MDEPLPGDVYMQVHGQLEQLAMVGAGSQRGVQLPDQPGNSAATSGNRHARLC